MEHVLFYLEEIELICDPSDCMSGLNSLGLGSQWGYLAGFAEQGQFPMELQATQ